MEHRKSHCLYCQSEQLKSWGDAFLRCTDCGLIFRASMPSAAELDEIYRSYYSRQNIANQSTHMESCPVAMQGHLGFIDKHFSSAHTILDYGAGTGDLVALLRENGFDADGVEFSSGAVEEAYSRHNLRLISSLDDLENKTYDLITAIEVVEHLPEPWIVFKQLFALLRPGGWLYIATPSANGLLARLQKSQWREALKPFHLVFFNVSSIRRILTDSGFNIVRHIRFSPLTTSSLHLAFLHRILQGVGLSGGLRVIAEKPADSGNLNPTVRE